jgi:hypothetical protein
MNGMEGPAQTPPQVAVVKHRVQKRIFFRRNQATMLVTAKLSQSKIPPSDPVPQLRAAHSQSALAATSNTVHRATVSVRMRKNSGSNSNSCQSALRVKNRFDRRKPVGSLIIALNLRHFIS